MTACTRTGTGLNDEHQTYAILKVFTSDKSPKTFSVTFGFLIPIFVTSNHFVLGYSSNFINITEV